MAHKLITKLLQHAKKYIFCQSDKNRYNFDSFTLDGYYCVDCCHFFNLTIWGKRGQYPWLSSQVLHVLKILAAHRLQIADSEEQCWAPSMLPVGEEQFWEQRDDPIAFCPLAREPLALMSCESEGGGREGKGREGKSLALSIEPARTVTTL